MKLLIAFFGHWAQTFIAQAFEKETVEDFTGNAKP